MKVSSSTMSVGLIEHYLAPAQSKTAELEGSLVRPMAGLIGQCIA
jgi:hypothetical protein